VGDQYCLSTAFGYAGLPAVCVPGCGSKPCPPNFYCLKDAGPAYQPVCAPGLPGFRCARDEDCIFGYCVDTGEGFSLCAVDCTSEADCATFYPIRGHSLCLDGSSEGENPPRRHCLNHGAFAGLLCASEDHCPDGEVCADYNPYDPTQPRPNGNLECRRTCDENTPCSPLAGIPFSCLLDVGQCYPGDIAIPCTRDDECMGDLRCECISGCDPPETSRKICTRRCETDAPDCQAYSLVDMVCHAGRCMTPLLASQ
jgi:hypothetical protein